MSQKQGNEEINKPKWKW